MEDYPREVRTPPLLLAALAGASPLHTVLTEALHESAVAACGQKRVRYLSWDYDFQVPVSKRGSQDAPGYIVQGILKRRWLEKVCNELPAVVVACFDWSAEPQPSQAGEAQAVAHLQHARRQINAREIRILVFVVLHADIADPEVACGLLRQQPDIVGLVVARGEADVTVKAQKLERLVYTSAMAFYADEEKRRRRVRTPATPVATGIANALQVRSSLKVGYTCEFRRDTRGALKSYIKAYEQLIHDTEIADVVERMGLCNHITLRMYQLYLQSHDVSAAVHHCRIHTATLRSCHADDQVMAWRKWYWLAANHQLFAELLESVVQQLPLLIDQADMWQFTGFHYQSAASYINRLQQWARAVLKELPPAGQTGGVLVPSAYIGQADLLEIPSDCNDPARKVSVRRARAEAEAARTGDRCLQVLTRAHAAYKERNYSAGASACTARMADEYLGDGNVAAAIKLYERLRQDTELEPPRQGSARPVWPSLHRFALERAILCSCRELGIEKIPSVCLRSSVTLRSLSSASTPTQGEDLAAVRSTARRRLLLDTFAYLSLAAGASPGSTRPLLTEAQQSELLEAVQAALADERGEEQLEVPFDAAMAYVDFGLEESQNMSIKLQSPLAAALEVKRVFALTSRGPLELKALIDTGESAMSWRSGQELDLHGDWQALPSASHWQEVQVTSLRLVWATAAGVVLLVKDLQQLRPTQLLPPFRSPSLGGSSTAVRGGQAADVKDAGVRSDPRGAPFRAQAFLPVSATSALVSEFFVCHILLLRKRSAAALRSTVRLSLSCTLSLQEERFDPPGDSAQSLPSSESEPSVSLISRPTSDNGAWTELRLDTQANGQVVAELAEGDPQLRAVGSALVLSPTDLSEGPSLCGDDEEPMAIPVAVCCHKTCKATLNFAISCLEDSAQEASSGAATKLQVVLSFRTALQVAVEDRTFGSASAKNGPGAIRKLVLKSLTTVPLAISSMTAAAADGTEASAAVLGMPGSVAPQSSHVFAMSHSCPSSAASALVSRFGRVDAVPSFFPWPRCSAALPSAPLPCGLAKWVLPKEPPKLAPTQLGALKVELEHGSTGTVAQPMEVKVCVRRSTQQSIQEFRVRVLQGPGESALASDRFFLTGPMSTQVVLLATSDSQAQTCSSFQLVPLQPGWLQMPRVQVTDGNQEVITLPSSIFIFPSTQPILWRANA